jgi:hypothetical protein
MRAAETDTPRLPDDPAALRALLLTTLARLDTLSAERDALVNRPGFVGGSNS